MGKPETPKPLPGLGLQEVVVTPVGVFAFEQRTGCRAWGSGVQTRSLRTQKRACGPNYLLLSWICPSTMKSSSKSWFWVHAPSILADSKYKPQRGTTPGYSLVLRFAGLPQALSTWTRDSHSLVAAAGRLVFCSSTKAHRLLLGS